MRSSAEEKESRRCGTESQACRNDPFCAAAAFPGIRWALAAILLISSGCAVKRTVEVAVPAGIREARSADFEELAGILRDRELALTSLSSNALQATYTSGKIESGQLEEYRSAPGYLLLKRPDSIRINIQNPVTKTTILEMRSVGDDFSIWYPRKNKFYVGKNSTREFDLEGDQNLTLRPYHLYQALMPAGLEAAPSDGRIAMEEDQDEKAKYYVLSLYEASSGPVLHPLRKLWIDRANFAAARQLTYGRGGTLEGITHYSDIQLVDGIPLPLIVRMERPLDGYRLDIRFKSWRVNPEFPDGAFDMTPPSGAEIEVLRPKVRD